MNEWIQNMPGAKLPDMNQKVDVMLAGDEEIYTGICIKPRKLWVEVGDPIGIADEGSIVSWRPAATT